jgi:hypothetical protein
MATEIIINPDQTITPKWTGRRGGGSLFQCMADGNAKKLNAMSFDDVLLVFVLARVCAFPLGNQRKVYEMCIADGALAKCFPAGHAIRGRSLGELRRAAVYESGDSCNGPLDGWLTWLYDFRQNEAQAAKDCELAAVAPGSWTTPAEDRDQS